MKECWWTVSWIDKIIHGQVYKLDWSNQIYGSNNLSVNQGRSPEFMVKQKLIGEVIHGQIEAGLTARFWAMRGFDRRGFDSKP